MEIVQVPPINLSPVTDTAADWKYLERDAAVNFTRLLDGQRWSAEFLLENCGTVVLRAPVDLFSDGGVSVTIPQEISASIRSAHRIDAAYQIRFTAPLPDLDMVWRGPVVVLEITP